MGWFKTLVLFYIVGYQPVWTYNSTFFIKTYGNLSAAIAKYYSSACIYLLTHSEEQDKMELFMTTKYISRMHGISNTVLTFSDYFDLLNTISDLDLCYVPVQVIIDNDENHQQLREAFSLHSNRTSMHGPDQYNGGVWLIFLKSLDMNYVEGYFRSINTPFDVEIIVAYVDKSQVLMKEVYRVAPGFPLRQPYFGQWSVEKGPDLPMDPLLYARRSDLEGLELKVGYDEIPPMTIIKRYGNTMHLRGFLGDVWSIIQTAMNVSCRFEKYEELGAHSNGVYTGLLKGLKYSEIDIAVSPFILTRDRFEDISFSFPLVPTSFQIFYQNPGSITDINWFLCPFGTDVWITIIAWFIIGSTLLYFSCYISHYRLENEENFTLVQSFFVIFHVLCAQGTTEVPKNVPNRILFLVTLMIATIVIPCYSASLVSYLTIRHPVVPFTNFKDLYDGNTYRLLVRKGSYEYDLFEDGSDSDPYIRKLFERDLKSKKVLPLHNSEGISMLCKNRYAAFFGIETSIDWNLEDTERDRTKSGCFITKMDGNAGRISIGYGFSLKSHLRGIVNHHIKNLESTGVLDRIKKAYWAKQDTESKEKWMTVTLESTALIFGILLFGIMLAAVIFFLELYLGQRRCSLQTLNKKR